MVLRQALLGPLSRGLNTALGIVGRMREVGSAASWTVKTLPSVCVLSLKTTVKPGAQPVGAECMGFPSNSHLATNGLGEEDTYCLAELGTLRMSLSTSLLHIATIPHRSSCWGPRADSGGNCLGGRSCTSLNPFNFQSR